MLPVCSDSRRSDVVALNSENKAYLADMTCCEIGDNLNGTRSRKVEKCNDLKCKIEEDGYETSLDALMV